MSRQKKLVNKTNIPEHEIEKIARCFYPDIVRDFTQDRKIRRNVYSILREENGRKQPTRKHEIER